ncbi:MAG: CocE/NonD family hydrolase [Actinomycetota bacterium]
MPESTTGAAVELNNTIHVRDVSSLADEVIVEPDVGVIVRDGTRLSTKVFRPATAGEYPVVLVLTAYGKDLGPDTYPEAADYAEDPDFDNGVIVVSPWTTWEGPDPATWVPEGYAVVYLDVRGYHQSGGDASVLSPQDAEDFYDVIEWAASQEWSNGNVGTVGVSYLAIAQWAAAGLNPPGLKAMIPWEGQTDSFREVLYHGGVPETSFTKFWLNRVNGLANTPPLPEHELFAMLHRDPQAMTGIREQQFIRPELSEVPVLVAATWSDHGMHTRGSFGGFAQTSATQKWLFTHGQPKWSTFYGPEAIECQQQFFDHFLKGDDSGLLARPTVRLEVRDTLTERAVRFEHEWPIARTEYRRWYLDGANGELVVEPPAAPAVASYAPLTDGATFTVTFDEETELTGHMTLRLWVSTTEGTDMDLFVGIRKFDAAGDEVHFYAKAGYTKGPVAQGWLRVSERALDEERSTEWQPVLRHDYPQPISPQEIVPVDIEILPSSTRFGAGESLQLVVQGTDLFEHPALGHAYSHEVNQGTHSIYTGGDRASYLLLPHIPAANTVSV